MFNKSIDIYCIIILCLVVYRMDMLILILTNKFISNTKMAIKMIMGLDLDYTLELHKQLITRYK